MSAPQVSILLLPLHAVPREELLVVPDKFDPYREALVMETHTIWPVQYEALSDSERARIEAALHADPNQCANLEYIRTHTGFCRQITVTPEDMQRLGS
jgi:hypothetical protein